MAELVQLKVDVLVVRSLAAIRAAKQATKTIPIVMVTTQDPVVTGLIDSLARPDYCLGGRTGIRICLSDEHDAERLDQIADAACKGRRAQAHGRAGAEDKPKLLGRQPPRA